MTTWPKVFLPPSFSVFLQLIDPILSLKSHGACFLGLSPALARTKNNDHVGFRLHFLDPGFPQQLMR